MCTPKMRYLTAGIVAALFLSAPLLMWGFSSNPPLGNTGAPGEGNCSSCHGGGSGGGNVSIAFSGGGANYTPGTPQTLTITINDPNSSSAFGFEMTALEGSVATTPGTFAAVSTNVSPPATSGAKIYERHLSDASNTFQLTWTPPASTVYSGPVVFYVASVAGDGSQFDADSLYQANYTLTPAVAAPKLSATPGSLSFSYTQNGTVPAIQNVSITSSGSALSYTAAASTSSGGNWLSATPASSTTPGTESVSVNPAGLAPGTYSGTVTVTASGASNSPLSVPVTLTVTAAAPNLTATPSSLTFNYQIGGTAPAAQTVSVGSTGAALSYTVTSTTTSGGSWLSATPASSTTPGTETVSVNTTGLAAGTYTGSITVTSSGAANSPQITPVTLVVSMTGTLQVRPHRLRFFFHSGRHESDDDWDGLSRTLTITSSGGPLSYTATAFGGSCSWLSVNPSSGTTPGQVTVSVDPYGLARGKYTGQVEVAASSDNSVTVPVTLTVFGGEEGAGDRENNDLFAAVYTFDPSNTGAVSAEWVYGAGVPESNPKDPTNQGLVLMNNAKGQGQARAGVIVHGASGLTLTALGFDIRKGSLCTANSPQFQVVTDDGVVHTLSGCAAGSNLQSSPAPGWDRLVFDPAQATPAIARDSTIKSLALMLDDGPDANGGMVVLDNINVNGQFIGKE